MLPLRGKLIAQTGAALCLAQLDTDGSVSWWLPLSELHHVERSETLGATIISCTAHDWLVSQKSCHALISDAPASQDQTLSLFPNE